MPHPSDDPAFTYLLNPTNPYNMRHGLTKKQWYAGCWLCGAYADPANRSLSPAALAKKAKAFADATWNEIHNGL